MVFLFQVAVVFEVLTNVGTSLQSVTTDQFYIRGKEQGRL